MYAAVISLKRTSSRCTLSVPQLTLRLLASCRTPEESEALTIMTTSPASPSAPTKVSASAAATVAISPSAASADDCDSNDDDSEDCEMDPLSDEANRAMGVPYISLLARAKVLEQVMEGPQRRNSLVLSSSRDSSDDNQVGSALGAAMASGPGAPDPSKRMFKKTAKTTRSFRMSFMLNSGDDGLDDLVNNISSEGTDRRTLVIHAALALWEHRRQAAALRCWKEVLVINTNVLELTKTGDLNEEARRILYSAEATRAAIENAAASAPISPRAGSQSFDVVMPVKFARGDLDLLVVWAREMQAKTFPRGVEDAAIREAMKYVRFRQYQDGDALFFEGEIGEIFYFLFQGTVAVYVGSSKSQLKNVEGTRRTTRIQGKPDLKQLGKRVFAYRTGEGFGETAMFTNDAIRTASAIAVGSCEVCELPKEIYRRTLKKFHQQFFEQAQKINFVQRVALFRDWQRVRLSAVADLVEKRKLAFGDHLVVEGSTVLTSCYFVLTGLVKLTKYIDMAPPPLGTSTNQSTSKKPKHRIQMNIELQTLGIADIVALEALLEPNSRATYSAVAASASVEVYVLKEVDARSILGSAQSALYQRVREMCMHERHLRAARLNSARQTFQDHEVLKRDAELLQSQDDFDNAEQLEQSTRKALDARANAALQGANVATSPLLSASAAPYLPHLRAASLLEITKTPFVPMSSACRAELDAMTAIASPKMLSTCAKNFIFEHANTLASDYPERLRLHFPAAPPVNRSLVEKVTALMSPVSPTTSSAASPSSSVTMSPRQTARRIKPTSESRDEQRVLGQQMQRLHESKMHWDAARKDFVLLPPPAAKPSIAKATGATTHPVRPTTLHHELKATQDAARKLVEDHLRKVNQRRSEAPGQATFLHFF